MLSSFSTTFLTMKKCNRVVLQSMRSGAVRHNGAQFRKFYFFFTLFPRFKKFKKNICCEGYSKACSRKIWLWSLSNITSKKNFEKFKNFFQLQFFSQILVFFFCGIVSLVSTTYIFFIEIGQAVFKKNHFKIFLSPSITPKKMNF